MFCGLLGTVTQYGIVCVGNKELSLFNFSLICLRLLFHALLRETMKNYEAVRNNS